MQVLVSDVSYCLFYTALCDIHPARETSFKQNKICLDHEDPLKVPIFKIYSQEDSLTAKEEVMRVFF